jgi:hypothetical protein
MTDHIYETVTEKPLEVIAYRVRDFDTDDAVVLNNEARNCLSLPGVRSASLVYEWSGQPVLVVTFHDGESARISCGCWLVIRQRRAPIHPLDIEYANMQDRSGRVMTYTDAEFQERYSSSSVHLSKVG